MQFAKYRAGVDPTQIPSPGLLPHRHKRKSPYVYSQDEIRKLIEVAKRGSATNDEVRIGTFYWCDRVIEFTGTGGRRTMLQFLDRYAQEIAAVLSGFDRLVFRGLLRRHHDPRRGESENQWLSKELQLRS
jgi:hypothetical protein